MRIRTFLLIPILTLAAALVTGCAGTSTSPPLNFGDHSIGNLSYWADSRRGAGDLDQALIYVDKLIEVHSPEAREMQASLSDYPPIKDVYSYGTLNGVGDAYLKKSSILMEKGDTAGAREALNTLIRNFSYAQSQGRDGNWTKAAEVAEKKLKNM